MKTKPSKDRFVWLVGAIKEAFPDVPECPADGSLVLWDRSHNRAAVTVAPEYAQAICLELTTVPNGAPFTSLETWLNGLSKSALKSEGLPL